MSADLKLNWDEADIGEDSRHLYVAKIVPGRLDNFPLECLVDGDSEDPAVEIPFSSPTIWDSLADKGRISLYIKRRGNFFRKAVSVVMARRNKLSYRLSEDLVVSYGKLCQVLDLPRNGDRVGYGCYQVFGNSDRGYEGSLIIRGNPYNLGDFCHEIENRFKSSLFKKEFDDQPVSLYLGRLERKLKTFKVSPVNFQIWKEQALEELQTL